MISNINILQNHNIKKHDILYIFVLVFMYGLFALDEYYATKLFYIPSVILILLIMTRFVDMLAILRCRIFIFLSLFIGYLIVNSAFAGVLNAYDVKYAFRIIGLVVMVALVLHGVSRTENFFGFIILFTILGSFPDVYRYVAGSGITTQANFGIGAKFHWHTLAGGVYSMVSLLVLHKALNSINRFLIVLYMTTFLYLSCLIYLTQSRGAILSLVVAVTVVVALSAKRKRLLIGALAGSFGLFYVIYNLIGFNMTSLVQRKDAGRFDIWGAYLEKVAESPIIGYGLHPDFIVLWQGVPMEHSHNLFLETLVFGGVVGLFLLVILFICSFHVLYLNRKLCQTKIVFAILSCIIILSMFDSKGIVDNVGVVWILLWMPFGLALSIEYAGRSDKQLILPNSSEHYVNQF